MKIKSVILPAGNSPSVIRVGHECEEITIDGAGILHVRTGKDTILYQSWVRAHGSDEEEQTTPPKTAKR